MAAAAAARSRCSNRSRPSGVSRVGTSNSSTPGTAWVLTGKPLSRNTLIILWLWGRTSAPSTPMPARSATSASWPSRIVPSPRPCMASAIASATSARSGRSGSRSQPAWASTRPSPPVASRL